MTLGSISLAHLPFGHQIVSSHKGEATMTPCQGNAFCATGSLLVGSTGHRWISPVSGGSSPVHYSDVIMGMIASRITSLTIVYSTIYSDADQRKHQSFASLAFVLGIHRGPVNSPHKWPVTRKMFPFDDVIMGESFLAHCCVGCVIPYG